MASASRRCGMSACSAMTRRMSDVLERWPTSRGTIGGGIGSHADPLHGSGPALRDEPHALDPAGVGRVALPQHFPAARGHPHRNESVTRVIGPSPRGRPSENE